jgi:aryl-alcohol dehydrogenase-like predicted oxidoreductase
VSADRGHEAPRDLEENVAAARLVLTAEELAQLGAALPPTAGPRYGEKRLAELDG